MMAGLLLEDGLVFEFEIEGGGDEGFGAGMGRGFEDVVGVALLDDDNVSCHRNSDCAIMP